MEKTSRGPINFTPIIAGISATVAVISFFLGLPNNFTLSLSSQEGSVLQGEKITTEIRIDATWRNRQRVSLSASGGPEGTNYTFSPVSGPSRPGFRSELSIMVDKNSLPGRYEVIITGIGSNGEERNNKYFLNLKPAPIQQVDSQSQVASGVGQVVFPAYIEDLFSLTGRLGDADDLSLDISSTEDPHSIPSCLKLIYSTSRTPIKGWAGLYWQYPDPTTGYEPNGKNLTGSNQLTFWARGEKATEKVKFMVAGATTGFITLTSKWKQYTLDLSGKDLSNIKGGFSFIVNRTLNPDGCTFYLDDIRYER